MTDTTDTTITEGPWVPDLDTFGARLALVRQAEHWNVLQAATACGLDDESWRQWENGRSPRNMVDVARKIAAGSGCDLHWLLTGDASPGAVTHRFPTAAAA